MNTDLLRRASIHAALGEPIRLAIVDDLRRSDRSPGELAARLDLSGNLLAHHLDTLEAVGLIDRFVSSGDRRRRYVRLNRSPLSQLDPPLDPPAENVTFICTHNAARSQLAAALWEDRVGTKATSAGTRPSERVHPRAVAAARRVGLDLGGATPRLVEPSQLQNLVVTVCDQAHEELDVDPSWLHWSIPDPGVADTDTAFAGALNDLEQRIHLFRTAPSHTTHSRTTKVEVDSPS